MPHTNSTKPSIALIITAHNEGIKTWPGFRSAHSLAEEARRSGYEVTVCGVLDNADTETTRLGRQAHEYGLLDQLVETNVGDPGQARLAGINATASDLIAIMDADDLISYNWLVEAADQWCRGDGYDVIHPEWRLFFGGYWAWQKLISQTDKQWQIKQQLFIFDHSSTALASRQLWRQCPYQPAAIGSGFGHEDWHWGLEAIAAGYRHVITPETIRFYRYRHDSVCRQHDRDWALLRPSTFFDLPQYREIETAVPVPIKTVQHESKLRNYLVRIGDYWRAAIIATFDPITRRLHTRKRIGRQAHPGNNQKLIDLWRAASRLEPTLSTPWITPEQVPYMPVGYRNLTTVNALPKLLNDYDEAAKESGGEVTHLIFVPWIMQSGGDRVAAEYARAIRLSGGKPMIVLTERSLVEPEVLPSDIPVIDAAHLQRLDHPDRLFCLGRLLVQKQPEHIIIINAVAAWEAVGRYPKAISEHTKIWSVGFTDDETPDRRMVSWTKLYLEQFAPYLSGIMTDSNIYRLDLELTFGLPPGLVTAAYTPIPLIPGNYRNDQPRKRVLWTGRFDRQKRPDRLIKLAVKFPEVDFIVWGRGYLEDSTTIIKQMARMPNIILRGSYTSINDIIAHDKYDAFIYTAQWDGLPIVILEAISINLPIVTTDSGGVSEIIDDTTGWIVSQEEGPLAFTKALRECLDDRAEATKRAERALIRLQSRHNAAVFMNSLHATGMLSTTKQKPN